MELSDRGRHTIGKGTLWQAGSGEKSVNKRRGHWTVVDLFSGCGGMSYGFAHRRRFRIIAAVDAEERKPSDRTQALDCNSTYAANIGIEPLRRDIRYLDPRKFFDEVRDGVNPPLRRGQLTVLLCSPPCTDFSRAKPANHFADSAKNSLAAQCAGFAEVFLPEFVILENARELMLGNHSHHYKAFTEQLERMGYSVRGEVYMLTEYGLPQTRERAIVVASRIGPVKTFDDLWEGWRVSPEAVTVRRGVGYLNRRRIGPGEIDPRDPMHRAAGFSSELVRRRIEAIPRDGGSWRDLINSNKYSGLLIDSMKAKLREERLGSHSDVYGRLAWDRPAITIKRECAHVGNGRYTHPEQTRLLTIREMALLQGFPRQYQFVAEAIANRYRHIGDAVPPLIAYQLSALVGWMKTGVRPRPRDWVLPGTSLRVADIKRAR